MHVKEFNIITDYTNKAGAPCIEGLIVIANNLSCGTCGYDVHFEPMFSDGDIWRCLSCWIDAGNEPPSAGTEERLAEATATTKANYLIRNM